MKASTKGKVERGIGYVRGNFWVRVAEEVRAGRLELSGLNGRAREWTEGVANQRVHATHGEVVARRYAEEEPLLGKVGGRVRYDTDYHSLRSTGKDARLSYRGKTYELSRSHALEQVEVTESLGGRVSFRSKEGQALGARLVGPPLLPTGTSAIGGIVAGSASADPRPGADGRLPDVTASGPAAPPKPDVGRLLRLVARDGLEVEERDLSVYEEVANGSVPR